MDDRQIKTLAEAWLHYHNLENTAPERDDYWWAVQEEMELCFDQPDLLWRFILTFDLNDLSDRMLAVLAAGPVENLLSHHGSAFIDRIELRARQDSRFNLLLGGVWQQQMADDVWARIQAVRFQSF